MMPDNACLPQIPRCDKSGSLSIMNMGISMGMNIGTNTGINTGTSIGRPTQRAPAQCSRDLHNFTTAVLLSTYLPKSLLFWPVLSP